MTVPHITKADVLALAASLSSVTDAAWALILPFVNEMDLSGLGESVESTTLARTYLAAHLGEGAKPVASGGGAAAGPVISESVGGVRRSYANLAAASTGAALLATKWGRYFDTYLKLSLAHGPVVI